MAIQADSLLAFRSVQLASGRARRRIAAGLERACRKPGRAAIEGGA